MKPQQIFNPHIAPNISKSQLLRAADFGGAGAALRDARARRFGQSPALVESGWRLEK